MNIRSEALAWFSKKFPLSNVNVFTSKCYTAEESWSKTKVWFFQIPLAVVYKQPSQMIFLVCENLLQGEPFLCIKVSSFFFLKHMLAFDVDRTQDVVRIYLSAEAADMYREVRGRGKVDFRPYLL